MYACAFHVGQSRCGGFLIYNLRIRQFLVDNKLDFVDSRIGKSLSSQLAWLHERNKDGNHPSAGQIVGRCSVRSRCCSSKHPPVAVRYQPLSLGLPSYTAAPNKSPTGRGPTLYGESQGTVSRKLRRRWTVDVQS